MRYGPRRAKSQLARMSLLGLAVGSVLLALMVACGSSGQTINGTVTLSDSDANWSHDKRCSGEGGYDDLRSGAQVVVANQTGEIIATSNLQEGVGKHLVIALWELGVELAESEGRTAAPRPDPSDLDIDANLVQCEFTFAIQVPDATFYSIEVSHRGEIRYSREELAERDWTVGLTLGP